MGCPGRDVSQTRVRLTTVTAHRIAYLGPRGTFTEQATDQLIAAAPADTRIETVAFATIGDALGAVREGDTESAVVPLENSVEGAVGATLDELSDGEELTIRAEIVVPVQFGLYVQPGATETDVRTFASHPHAEAQCRRFVRRVLPHASYVRSASTADAAAAVSRGEYDAAICAEVAGRDYGLIALATDIADNPGAITRFVNVTKPGPVPAPTADDLTSLVVRLPHTAGSLAEALAQFSIRGVNLTRIESRPVKSEPGEYRFFIDAAGHIDDPDVAEALAGLHRFAQDVRYLGSYPRWVTSNGVARRTRDHTAYDEARAWLAGLRRGDLR